MRIVIENLESNTVFEGTKVAANEYHLHDPNDSNEPCGKLLFQDSVLVHSGLEGFEGGYITKTENNSGDYFSAEHELLFKVKFLD